MAKIQWSLENSKKDIGLQSAVLYGENDYTPWFGLVSADDISQTTISTEVYFDGVLTLLSERVESAGLDITAFTYPSIFESFHVNRFLGLVFITEVLDTRYLHLIYDCVIIPGNKVYKTHSSLPNTSLFEFKLRAADKSIDGFLPLNHFLINLSMDEELTQNLLDRLFGTVATDPYLPTPQELVSLFETKASLIIRHNGDGTWTAIGPDSMLSSTNGEMQITAPSAYNISSNYFLVSSI